MFISEKVTYKTAWLRTYGTPFFGYNVVPTKLMFLTEQTKMARRYYLVLKPL